MNVSLEEKKSKLGRRSKISEVQKRQTLVKKKMKDKKKNNKKKRI